MKIIKRTMQSEITDKYVEKCQASLNSDGSIVLRSYTPFNKDNDEIFVLSTVETDAIFALMRKIKARGDSLPF